MSRLLLGILLFVIACKKDETKKLTDIEQIQFENFSPEEFYQSHNIFNAAKVNVDSLNVYNKEVLIGAYQIDTFDIDPKNYVFYPDYTYYSQRGEMFDHITEKEIKDEQVSGGIPVSEIAFFRNIKFNYAHFILDKKSNRIVGCRFSTIPHSEANYYQKTMDWVRKELGKPQYSYNGFSDDEGGAVHYPLVYDIWIRDGKMLQFNKDIKDEGDKKYEYITLLTLNENLIDIFDSSQNLRFTLFKDFFDPERSRRHMLEGTLMKRFGKNDLERAAEMMRKHIDSVRK
ncbi:hypothetical protein [Chryseobacterium jejuense]|uniref:hypothetical protein n=1 Tax=Chryseobacterium jejuense TaxID=445960 RepID=UPI001AE9D9F6|nr:hypothetical protein [Chryseobacterium jejuense]MBP2616589.1 hypothetical protein [Chryseobacterium jejuense]